MTTETRATGDETWTIDPDHTHVEFAVKHMMIATVRGSFSDVQGTVTFPADGGMPSLDVAVKTASIDTRSKQRDEHLRSGDFFDVENHPDMRFVSRRLERDGDDWIAEGDLTIRGETHPVKLDVTEEGRTRDPWGNERMAITAKGKINRKVWGLNWNQALEAGGFLVGDDVKLTIEAQLVRAEQSKRAAA